MEKRIREIEKRLKHVDLSIQMMVNTSSVYSVYDWDIDVVTSCLLASWQRCFHEQGSLLNR
ncbi:MAG: hypothetical protein QXU13_06125 [Desulfurococcaceae archaeon]